MANCVDTDQIAPLGAVHALNRLFFLMKTLIHYGNLCFITDMPLGQDF